MGSRGSVASLALVDKDGKPVWERDFPISDPSEGFCLSPATGGGYVLA